MNVYDEAHSLARAIKESNEYKEFDRMRKAVDADKECADMLKELQELQMQLQAAQLAGQQPDKDLFARSCRAVSSGSDGDSYDDE